MVKGLSKGWGRDKIRQGSTDNKTSHKNSHLYNIY